MVFIIETEYVYCAVRADSLFVIHVNFALKELNDSNRMLLLRLFSLLFSMGDVTGLKQYGLCTFKRTYSHTEAYVYIYINNVANSQHLV